VTHPFHPWFGRVFVFLAIRQTWSEDRVFFLDGDSRQYWLHRRARSRSRDPGVSHARRVIVSSESNRGPASCCGPTNLHRRAQAAATARPAFRIVNARTIVVMPRISAIRPTQNRTR
jgi:hypothetical protein